MNLKKSTLIALGIGALAIPAAAVADPGGNGHGHGHGHGGNPTVMYLFKGTYGDTADGTVAVNHGNAHVRKADLVGQDVQFDLTDTHLVVADTDGDGAVTANDIAPGDKVLVQARLPKQDPGAQPFAAKRLVDQTNSGDDSTD
jgi:hypothetical protein